jgi:hypothetical protein
LLGALSHSCHHQLEKKKSTFLPEAEFFLFPTSMRCTHNTTEFISELYIGICTKKCYVLLRLAWLIVAMYSQNCSILVNGNKPFAKNNDLQKE